MIYLPSLSINLHYQNKIVGARQQTSLRLPTSHRVYMQIDILALRSFPAVCIKCAMTHSLMLLLYSQGASYMQIRKSSPKNYPFQSPVPLLFYHRLFRRGQRGVSFFHSALRRPEIFSFLSCMAIFRASTLLRIKSIKRCFWANIIKTVIERLFIAKK